MTQRLGRDQFAKYHALGNDYLVVDPRTLSMRLTPARIRALCDRHTGIGSDGILALEKGKGTDFGLRIFNPDGSEAEKSGNGLRILARFLRDHGYTAKREFTVSTRGGTVSARLHLRGREVSAITVDMGRAEFLAVDKPIRLAGRTLRHTSVSVGNPHCVIVDPALTRDDLLALGPRLEAHPSFPNRVNVQFASVPDRKTVRLMIWERGAGETKASGSSACATAAACRRLGLVDDEVTAVMAGGRLALSFLPGGMIRMTGPATPVYTGRLSG